MNLTELELRELTSVRDKLRHRLRVQLVESENGTGTDDQKTILRNKIGTFRESIGEAYRKRDLYRMRAYFNMPSQSVLDYYYRQTIDNAIASLHTIDAFDTMNSFNDEHVEACKRIVNVISGVKRGAYLNNGEKMRPAVGFALANLEYEQIISFIITDRETLDLDTIKALMVEMQHGAASLNEGVL